MAYDPTNEAVVRECLHQLDAEADEAALAYTDALYALQEELHALMQRSPEEAPTPEQEQAVTQALAKLHPSADDHLIDYGERLQRLLARVDVELSRWTSSIVQPPGPSGATAVAERPAAPEEA